MTTLRDLTELVKKDDEIIIKNQEQSNEHLENIDKNFSKFFDLQERQRLDDLEDRLERKRAIKPAAGRGASGKAAAAASGLGFGTGLGVGASLKALASLLTKPGVLLAATTALFGRTAIRGTKEAYSALRNALSDRAMTNRGILRFEAEELKRYEQARKVQLEAERIKALNLANEKKRLAKDLIRNAENDQKLKDQARIAAAESEAEKMKAKLLKQQIESSTQTIRDLKNAKRIASNQTLSDTVDMYRATVDTSVELKQPTRVAPQVVDSIGNAIGEATNAPSRGPAVDSTSPSKIVAGDTPTTSAYQQLKAFSDADLGAAGYRRVQNLTTGSFAYTPIDGGNFVKLDQVLADIKATTLKGARATNRPDRSPSRPSPLSSADITPGGRVSMTTIRGISAAISPVEAAIQETAELAARSRYGAVAKTGATIAKVMGSVGFNAALFAIMPTMAADGTISGSIQETYNNMIRAILSPNMRAKDPNTGQELSAEQWQNKLKDQVKLHPSFFKDEQGATMKMIANLPTKEFVDFKSRVRMYDIKQRTANLTPTQIANAESQVMAGYGAFTANVGGVYQSTLPNFAENRRMAYERAERQEAFRAQEQMFGMGGGSTQAIGQVGDQNTIITNNNSGVVVEQEIDARNVSDTFATIGR